MCLRVGFFSLKPLDLPRTASLSLETGWRKNLVVERPCASLAEEKQPFALLGDRVTIVVELLPL